MEQRADLLSMTAAELKTFVLDLGEPAFRSGQIAKWL